MDDDSVGRAMKSSLFQLSGPVKVLVRYSQVRIDVQERGGPFSGDGLSFSLAVD